MKRLLALITIAAFGWVGLSSARAAPLPPCRDMDLQLFLEPLTASHNGLPAQPTSAGSGLSATDAGVQIYMAPSGGLTAVRATKGTCPRPIDQITMSVLDPWTGERFSLPLRGTR